MAIARTPSPRPRPTPSRAKAPASSSIPARRPAPAPVPDRVVAPSAERRSESRAQAARADASSRARAPAAPESRAQAARADASSRARLEHAQTQVPQTSAPALRGIAPNAQGMAPAAPPVTGPANAAAETPLVNAAVDARGAQSRLAPAQERLVAANLQTQALEAEAAQYGGDEGALVNARAAEVGAQGASRGALQEVERTQSALAELTRDATLRGIENRDPAERQQIVNGLSRAAEVAGAEGAAVMGGAAAEVLDAELNTSRVRAFGADLGRSIVGGHGALFGVETANAAPTNRRSLTDPIADALGAVTQNFDNAARDVGVFEGELAQLNSVHQQSLSPELNLAASEHYGNEAAAARERYDAASAQMLSIAQGAEVAADSPNLALLNERVAGITRDLRDVRGRVPDALGSESGQNYLRETLLNTPQGELPTHLVPQTLAEADALSVPLSSSVLSQPDEDRAGAVDNIVTHSAQLGLDELQRPGAREALTTLTSPAANARELSTGVAAFGASIGLLDLGSDGRPSRSAAGRFGSLMALTSAGLNLTGEEGTLEVGRAIREIGAPLSEISGDLLSDIGRGGRLAHRIAGVAGTGFGAANAVFGGLNALSQFEEGQNVDGALSLANAGGALLTLGRTAAPRLAGAYIGAAATVAQVGVNIHREHRANAAYNERASAFFESQGFSPAAAAHWAGLREPSAPILRRLGEGRGTEGSNLTAPEVFERLRTLPDRYIGRITEISERFPRLPTGELQSYGAAIRYSGQLDAFQTIDF